MQDRRSAKQLRGRTGARCVVSSRSLCAARRGRRRERTRKDGQEGDQLPCVVWARQAVVFVAVIARAAHGAADVLAARRACGAVARRAWPGVHAALREGARQRSAPQRRRGKRAGAVGAPAAEVSDQRHAAPAKQRARGGAAQKRAARARDAYRPSHGGVRPGAGLAARPAGFHATRGGVAAGDVRAAILPADVAFLARVDLPVAAVGRRRRTARDRPPWRAQSVRRGEYTGACEGRGGAGWHTPRRRWTRRRR